MTLSKLLFSRVLRKVLTSRVDHFLLHILGFLEVCVPTEHTHTHTLEMSLVFLPYLSSSFSDCPVCCLCSFRKYSGPTCYNSQIFSVTTTLEWLIFSATTSNQVSHTNLRNFISPHICFSKGCGS